ncbi:MAG TPA: copper homeostasis membrane protein CopD [Stellaceae bacterium]|nr:copper homeostasis membrane protein CopD [Stellaceae bacterium]
MQAFLIVARAVHFAAAISLTGVLAFECLVADSAYAARLRRQFSRLAWGSLALALLSGAGWLLAVTADMSGRPLAVALSQGMVGVVLTETRFGTDWLLRLAAAALLGILLVAQHQYRRRDGAALRWAALIVAALLLASLAWAGHGAATAGAAGYLHLAGDIVHLLAAGTWLGTLLPLALLLVEARRAGPPGGEMIRGASRRFSILAIVSVAALLVGGLVNTWFLAGTVPALVGTGYGRLLLAKIALFIAMLGVAAINLLRLTPRLARPATARAARAAAQLQRNALIELGLGLGVVGIVGLLGILPPGLHTEPGWPFPFRLDLAALSLGATLVLAIAAALFCLCSVAAVAAAAAGRYRRAAIAVAGISLCGAAGFLPLAPAVEPAYPTSFYASAEPYAAASVVRGGALYTENCVACHGAGGRGDGPAAAGLPIRPADLTEPHLFAHSPGDLFWWVSQGRGDGAMPGFGAALDPGQRWDVINFIRARAAGDLARQVGGKITAAASYPVPDFAFEAVGIQDTLGSRLARGPVLLVLYRPPVPVTRLRGLAAARRRLADAGLQVLATQLGEPADSDDRAPFVVQVGRDVRTALALFGTAADGGETDLMLDRNGDVRARWTAQSGGGLPDAAALIGDAARAARFAVAAPSHAGHAQ